MNTTNDQPKRPEFWRQLSRWVILALVLCLPYEVLVFLLSRTPIFSNSIWWQFAIWGAFAIGGTSWIIVSYWKTGTDGVARMTDGPR